MSEIEARQPTAEPAPPPAAAADLRVKTDVFEGPIDLLLTLAQRRRLDLNRLRLAELTADYLAALNLDGAAARPPQEVAAFLLVGSKLLALKAASLLPVEAEVEEEDLETWEERMRERMREYARFKVAALELMRRHQEGGFSFASTIEAQIVPAERLQLDPDGLAAAFEAVLARFPAPAEVEVRLTDYSLSDEMDRIRFRLSNPTAQGAGRTSFTELFAGAESRLHAVVIFLALLELIRRGEARIQQRGVFGQIDLSPGPRLGMADA
ncbi:MAG TPA: segregation/condensation protein A [Candidatus Dormibacteraeota bacterium]|nr:segregation/condensation protein A [Candidatus Dormibacteraeota bacterium]